MIVCDSSLERVVRGRCTDAGVTGLSAEGVNMSAVLLTSMMAAVFHGTAIPIFWVIGIILIIAGVVSLVRGTLVAGILLIVVGILMGGLNIF